MAISRFNGENGDSLAWSTVSPSAGDLIILFFANDGGDNQSTPGGLTRLDSNSGSSVEGGVYYRICTGSESGNLITNIGTFGISNEEYVFHLIKIPAGEWDGITPPELEAAGSGSGTINPPSISPSWGSEEGNIWVVGACRDDDDGISSLSNDYSENFLRTESGSSSGGCELATSWRINTAASEDPGNATQSGTSEEWMAWTIAVRPFTGSGDEGVTTEIFTEDGTFTVPAGVTEIFVECFGPGGASLNDLIVSRAAGAGGGAYAASTLSVSPGQQFAMTIPGLQPPTESFLVHSPPTVFGNDVVVADGGSSGVWNQTNPAGGRTSESIGDVVFAGGAGGARGAGGNDAGGGGGGCAGPGGAGSQGGDASGTTGGSAGSGSSPGGNGGAGGNTGNPGQSGQNPGGGAGGAGTNGATATGPPFGGRGEIRVTYTLSSDLVADSDIDLDLALAVLSSKTGEALSEFQNIGLSVSSAAEAAKESSSGLGEDLSISASANPVKKAAVSLGIIVGTTSSVVPQKEAATTSNIDFSVDGAVANEGRSSSTTVDLDVVVDATNEKSVSASVDVELDLNLSSSAQKFGSATTSLGVSSGLTAGVDSQKKSNSDLSLDFDIGAVSAAETSSRTQFSVDLGISATCVKHGASETSFSLPASLGGGGDKTSASTAEFELSLSQFSAASGFDIKFASTTLDIILEEKFGAVKSVQASSTFNFGLDLEFGSQKLGLADGSLDLSSSIGSSGEASNHRVSSSTIGLDLAQRLSGVEKHSISESLLSLFSEIISENSTKHVFATTNFGLLVVVTPQFSILPALVIEERHAVAVPVTIDCHPQEYPLTANSQQYSRKTTPQILNRKVIAIKTPVDAEAVD